jgi:alpha-glucosidase
MNRRLRAALVLFLLLPCAARALTESLAEGVVRCHVDAAARDAALPSLCLAEPVAAVGDAPAGFPVQVEFYAVNGRRAAHVEVNAGTSLYGTGEAFGGLQRNGSKVVEWNFDAYGYGADTPHLYQSHPWVLAVRADGTAYGVLADTPERVLIDLTGGILFVAAGPAFPVIVIDGDSPQTVLRRLASLVGTIDLPPLWALGWHQCRYSYTPDSHVLSVAEGFRSRDIPCDVIWLDIDYMDGYRSFTFHPRDFADPRGLTDTLHARGFHSIAIIDPGIRQEPGYFVYDSGDALDAWVRTRDGGPFVGAVWPGDCVFPDFTRDDVRDWWAGLYGEFLASGLDGVWNDMNEPAVFNVASKTMPLDNVHRADAELGGTGTHARYHNVYGMLMARATREGMQRARPARRPFVLTRANHLGGQRYAATWTGDNLATWEHLDASIPMILNLGLSGQPFAGPDVGGFGLAGDGRLYARWMGFGALFPFARGHTGKGNIDKEPWAFGPEVEATCRRALQARMRLLPYLYTLFEETARTGLPVWRPLFFADPADPRLRDVDDAFLIGDDLLVIARTTPDDKTEPPLPAGRWADVTAAVYGDAPDPDLPRLLLREGAALPLGPVVMHTGELGGPLTLLVHPDADGRAAGELYEDAGEGFGYVEGDFLRVRFEVRNGACETVRLGGERMPGAAPAVLMVR